jgi:hypothetical protein
MGSTLRRGRPADDRSRQGRHSLLRHDVSAANSGREVPVYLWLLFLLPIVVAQTCTTGACFSNSIIARALVGCGCWLTVEGGPRVWGTVWHFAVFRAASVATALQCVQPALFISLHVACRYKLCRLSHVHCDGGDVDED